MSSNVLIVDDSLTVRMDLQEAFDAAGFQSYGCATVAAAKDVLSRTPIDVIVLDVRLPDGDGVELLEGIRTDSRTSHAIVLMLSTESEVKDRIRGLRTGADEYIGKPYDTHYILARTNELLRAQRAQTASCAPATVLIIDDSATFRGTLRDAFEQAGYQVQTAVDGEDGLKVAALSRPGAIVVDSLMPGIDGATVIRRVRLDAALRGIPCLLMTGSEDIGAELRALDAGADAFVRKDEHTDLIVAKLAAAMRSAATVMPDDTTSLQGPKRVLAVDDSMTFLQELSRVLREAGYDVVQAQSGEDAMDLLAVQSVDCILLDLNMPGIGGRETCVRIKSAPVVRDIPLIILTAQSDHEMMLDGLGAGADDYLEKSGEFDVLKARVRAQIRRKQFEDENRRIRVELLKAKLEANEARAARALADSRAELLATLAEQNAALAEANNQLQARQNEIATAYSELTAANQAKTEFLSTMSHELRTPLNAIIGFSHIMIDGVSGPLTEQQRDFIGHIHEGGQHLLSLVNDLLDLSKIEAGKVDIDLEPIHLDSLLSDALNVVQAKAISRGIALSCLGLNLPDTFHADRRRVKQIIYNLLSNAVKFTPDKGMVTMRAELVDRQQAATGLPGFQSGIRMDLPESDFDRFVQISVTDNGIGIAQEDMDKLFKPFMQIKNELTRQIEGTGLGLATVMRLTQLHGGTVALSSEPGKGCCFSLWLPWRINQSNQFDDSEGHVDTSLPLALVIEDDRQALALMSAQLKAAGFRVRHAVSAEMALQFVPEFTPDLITLDVVLPGMDGWDFLARVKELPAWASVPVVVVSVVANHEIGVSMGATAVLQKPFGPRELMRELDRLGFNPAPDQTVKVVIVDDDPLAVELMSAYLQQPGYAVLSAFGGQEGIDMIQRHQPDLVVLDMLMADVGGIEVIEALKKEQATSQIPIIMVTAKQLSDADRKLLNSHVTSIVNKSDLHHNRFIGEVHRAYARHALATP